jgi:YcxB-like protein
VIFYGPMPAPGPIIAEVTLRKSEVYWANVNIISRQIRILLWIFAIFTVLMGSVYCLAVLNPRPGVEWQETIRGSKAFLFVLAIPLFLVFVAPMLNARRFFADPRNAKPTRYQFSDSGVLVQHSTGNSELNWTAFVKARETHSCFLLYVNKAWARVIPKRCFTEPSEITALRELVRKHLPER